MQGYNGTVLAYGQTGSGKTHTMSGGVGHYGVKERGITPRVIDHVFAHVANIKRRLKPGESIHISASAVEIYNEDFRDLSKTRGKDVASNNWDHKSHKGHELKLQVCCAAHLACMLHQRWCHSDSPTAHCSPCVLHCTDLKLVYPSALLRSSRVRW